MQPTRTRSSLAPKAPLRAPFRGTVRAIAASRSAPRFETFALPALVLLALLLLALLAPPPAFGQPAATPAAAPQAAPSPAPAADEAALTGRYEGVLVNLGNVLPRELASRITIHLEDLTPRAELARLGALLEEKGETALRNALADREVGRVQVDQGIGYPIAAALTTDGGDGMRHLVLVIARPMSIGEVMRGSRLADYPFSVVELDLEQQGYGTGEMMVAASIARLSPNRVTLDEYPVHPLRIVRVRQR